MAGNTVWSYMAICCEMKFYYQLGMYMTFNLSLGNVLYMLCIASLWFVFSDCARAYTKLLLVTVCPLVLWNRCLGERKGTLCFCEILRMSRSKTAMTEMCCWRLTSWLLSWPYNICLIYLFKHVSRHPSEELTLKPSCARHLDNGPAGGWELSGEREGTTRNWTWRW